MWDIVKQLDKEVNYNIIFFQKGEFMRATMVINPRSMPVPEEILDSLRTQLTPLGARIVEGATARHLPAIVQVCSASCVPREVIEHVIEYHRYSIIA